MSTSGVGIGMNMTTQTSPLKASAVPLRELTGCFVAAVGSTTRGTRNSPAATVTSRPAAVPLGGFVCAGPSVEVVPAFGGPLPKKSEEV